LAKNNLNMICKDFFGRNSKNLLWQTAFRKSLWTSSKNHFYKTPKLIIAVFFVALLLQTGSAKNHQMSILCRFKIEQGTGLHMFCFLRFQRMSICSCHSGEPQNVNHNRPQNLSLMNKFNTTKNCKIRLKWTILTPLKIVKFDSNENFFNIKKLQNSTQMKTFYNIKKSQDQLYQIKNGFHKKQ
jgi:hypothetical protein